MDYLTILKWDEKQHPRDKEGQFSEAADAVYVNECLRGKCVTFAVAMQQEMGGKLAVLEDPQPGEEEEGPLHVLVKFGKNMMDASGPVTLMDLKERYELSPKAKVRVVEEKEVRATADPELLKPEAIEEARQFIRRHRG